MELSRKFWRISKSWIILFWWLDRESLLSKLLLLCFPGRHNRWHIWFWVKWMPCSVVLTKIFWIDWFFFLSQITIRSAESRPTSKWIWVNSCIWGICPTCQRPKSVKLNETYKTKAYLGTSPFERKLPTLTRWQGNEYLTSGSTEIMAWKWLSNVERSWCLHPFYRQYFLGRKLFHSSHSQPFAGPSFLRVCLQSILTEADIIYVSLDLFTFLNVSAFLCCLYW